MSRGLTYGLLAIAILAILFVFLIFGISPSKAPSENIIRFGNTYWSLDNTPVFHGTTVWSIFADYPGNTALEHSNTIEIEHTTYWGVIPYDSEPMLWETKDGSFLSASLTFDDLMGRWQDSESVFKFRHEEDFYQVTFGIPKLENGANKYTTLLEAWNEGELYQIIEGL
jgi:hypothetical protein